MVKIRKRTEVTIETETVIIFPRGAHAFRAWCQPCGRESLLLTPEKAAKLAGVTTSVIYARVNAGTLHYTELSDGALFICGLSFGLGQNPERE